MHVRWFGETWGYGGRAPICDPDYWIPTPILITCLGCDEEIEAHDRGVAMAIGLSDTDTEEWRQKHVFAIEDGEHVVASCAYHVDCHLDSILGPGIRRLSSITRVGPHTRQIGFVPYKGGNHHG